jgi:hypothetical protein
LQSPFKTAIFQLSAPLAIFLTESVRGLASIWNWPAAWID